MHTHTKDDFKLVKTVKQSGKQYPGHKRLFNCYKMEYAYYFQLKCMNDLPSFCSFFGRKII